MSKRLLRITSRPLGYSFRGPPDMMSTSEGGGGHGGADLVREVARILQCKSVPNADKGGEGKKIEYFVDVINGSPKA